MLAMVRAEPGGEWARGNAAAFESRKTAVHPISGRYTHYKGGRIRAFDHYCHRNWVLHNTASKVDRIYASHRELRSKH